MLRWDQLIPPSLSYNDAGYDYMSTMILDTTSQHGRHFFDVNCQICTGKIPDPLYDDERSKQAASSWPTASRGTGQTSEGGRTPAHTTDMNRNPVQALDTMRVAAQAPEHSRRDEPGLAPGSVLSASDVTRDPRRSKQNAMGSPVQAKISPGIPAVAPPQPAYPLMYVVVLLNFHKKFTVQ